MAFPTSVNGQITDSATVEHVSEASGSKMRPKEKAGAHAGHATHSIREATHKGRKICIKTSYEITVDGEPVGGHVLVGDDGKVHYHSIPNQEFRSAVDMVKRLIDLMPPKPAEQPSAYSEEEG